MSREFKANAVLSIVAMSWGMGFVATASALQWLPPTLFLGFRFAIGFAIMALAFGKNLARTSAEEVKAGAITGSILACGFILQTYSMKYCSVATAAFLTALYVVMVPLLSAIFTGAPVDRLQAVAALVSFGGVAVSSPPTLVRELWPGELLGMGCAFFFALHILAVGRWAPGIEVSRFATIQIGAAAAVCLVAGLIVDPWPTGMPAVPAASLFYLGAVNTAGAFLAQNWAQKYTSVTQAAVLMSSEPVWAAMFGLVLLGQRLTPREIGGDIMILIGMVLAQDFVAANPRRRRPSTDRQT